MKLKKFHLKEKRNNYKNMNNNILQKTEELFYNKAFSDISMDEAAKNLWLKKATLYHHFMSKEDMFIKVLEFSYEKYMALLEQIFLEKDFKVIIKKLIILPNDNNNLFAVVLQKWYCNDKKIKDIIESKNASIDALFESWMWIRFNINSTKMILLRAIIDDFWKRSCISNCISENNIQSILNEISSIFICQ